jgi:hypothetical protein
MITSFHVAVNYDSIDEHFTATLHGPAPATWNCPDELEGTGETFADALRDLADLSEEAVV